MPQQRFLRSFVYEGERTWEPSLNVVYPEGFHLRVVVCTVDWVGDEAIFWTRFMSTSIPRSTVLIEKRTGSQLVKKFPAFYGTRRFITAFTSARYLSLSWASSIQSISSHPTSWRSTLILSSHLSLGLPSGLFPSGFPIKPLCNLHINYFTSLSSTSSCSLHPGLNL